MATDPPKQPKYSRKNRKGLPRVSFDEEKRKAVVTTSTRKLVAKQAAEAAMDTAGRVALHAENLMWEFALLGGNTTPSDFMRTKKGMSDTQARVILAVKPAPEWYAQKKAVADHATLAIVKRHVDLIAEVNDRHITASKISMAKAIEFMTKMKIEERRDKYGRAYFAGFKPGDLRHLVEVIATAQKIHRIALGLTAEEGSIQIWQQVNNTINNTGGAPVNEHEAQVAQLSTNLSYDEIRALIDSEERAKAAAITVESKAQ
jgi:hypothetical protein